MKSIRSIASLTIALVAITQVAYGEEKAPAAAYREATAAAIKNWQDLRFGMFIHWGPVSLKGTEIGWSRGKQVPVEEYDKLYQSFNPAQFNADEWAAAAKAAGMKYMVITAKHHDGFCLWPSEFTDYDISATPFKRDPIKELAEACREQGIAFGIYYSVSDWWHPDYPLDSPGGKHKKENHNMERYVQYMHDQTAELIENYGPLLTLWFDGEWEEPWTREYGNALYDALKSRQPSLVVNNRVSKGRHGMAGTTKNAHLNAGDYDTPEQRIGGFNRDRPWETCMTICKQWAWKPDDTMKSLQQCLQILLQTVGGDGNLLFNVGPMPDGRIEARQVERLKEMGQWLEPYSEAIYGTRGGPFKPGEWGASTCQGKTVNLFVIQWPEQGPLRLPGLNASITAAQGLDGSKIAFEATADGLTLDVPVEERDPIATFIRLTLDREALELPPVAVAEPNLEKKIEGSAQ